MLGSRSALAVLAAAVLAAATWPGMVTYAGAFFQDELDAHGAGLSARFAAVGGSYVLGGARGVGLARPYAPLEAKPLKHVIHEILLEVIGDGFFKFIQDPVPLIDGIIFIRYLKTEGHYKLN